MIFQNDLLFLPDLKQHVGTGWVPDFPDLRDYSQVGPELSGVVKQLGIENVKSIALPEKMDLRDWCSKIESQGKINSCTAHAAVGIVEYLERRAYGNYLEGSRLFVYKVTRNLMGVKGNVCAWTRKTMATLVLCGIPPEKYWKYTDEDPDFDVEPPAFVYSIADNFESLKYFCHDPFGKTTSSKDVLLSVKGFLSSGVPSMFGFFIFPSFYKSAIPGDIPYPCAFEKAIFGHAVVAVGYDDTKEIRNLDTRNPGTEPTTGALLIRNSWGKDWGENGYGWLPYEYVTNKLAADFWSLMSMKYVETGQFGLED